MKASRLLTLVLFAASIASASVIFSAGNIPQIDEPVLYHDSCALCVDGPANTVTGHLQTSDFLVNLTSEETLQVVAPGHNAVSGTSSTSGFDDMRIYFPAGYTFTSIIFQLTSLASATDGTVTFVAHLSGEPNVTSTAFFDSHTGGNYFTIRTTGGETLTELDFTTTQFQDNISQLRIGGAAGVVPEPATYGMVGFALVGLGWLRRRHSH